MTKRKRQSRNNIFKVLKKKNRTGTAVSTSVAADNAQNNDVEMLTEETPVPVSGTAELEPEANNRDYEDGTDTDEETDVEVEEDIDEQNDVQGYPYQTASRSHVEYLSGSGADGYCEGL